MPRRGGRRKKTRTHNLKGDDADEGPTGPCSFIVKKGRVCKELSQLVNDLRELMLPNSFSKVKESKRNSADDYVQVAGGLGATHLMRVSQNENNVSHLHLSRLPAGPSFDFRVDKFSLMADLRKVVGSSAAVSRDDGQFPPVAILNGFKNSSSEFTSLLGEAIKGLIPAIDISRINIRTCRRVVLFEYDEKSECLSIRHFRVNIAKRTVATLPSLEENAHASCSVMLNSRKTSKIPNMGNLVSLSDLVAPRPANTAAIEDKSSQIEISMPSNKNSKSTLSSLYLSEIGPRIDAVLSRVLSGVEAGTVLYSHFSPADVGTTVIRKKPKRKMATAEQPRKRHRDRDGSGFPEGGEDLGEFSE